MGIIQLPTQVPASVDINPNIRYMITTDSLSTITASGYLNAGTLEGYSISTTDILFVLYGYNTTTKTGTFGVFTVSLSSGNFTLSQWAGSTNAMQVNTVNTMVSPGQIILAKANGTEAANAVTANGNAGVITTSSLTTAGAGSYAITWTNTLITSSSVILLTLMGGTNTVKNITLQAVAGTGSATLTIYNNTAATALNGTILIGYSVF